ncbi:MAG: CPBP family intramembrane metalloprotease [Clostridia bacterium]|nr:CPBP family intramembrane metalloprotease [Clostridia bacterium]
MTLEEEQFTKWLKRPTIFIANSWFLLASAGQSIVGYIVAFIAQILALFGAGLSSEALVHTANAAYEIGILAIPVIWYASTNEGVDQSMRLNPPRLSAMLYAAVAAFAGVLMVSNIGTWWMMLIESLGGQLYASNIPIPTTLNELTTSILLVGVIPGVCEELFFRGALMGAWERRGSKIALIITSALFAMLHGSIMGLPTQLMMGFVLGYCVLITDSLYVGMVYHTIHNSTTLILTYLSMQSMDAAAEYASVASQVAAAGGMVTLAVQTVISIGMFAAAMMLLVRSQTGRGMKLEKITDGEADKTPMTWQELLVLIAGLLTVGIAYMNDLMRVCGGV